MPRKVTLPNGQELSGRVVWCSFCEDYLFEREGYITDPNVRCRDGSAATFHESCYAAGTGQITREQASIEVERDNARRLRSLAANGLNPRIRFRRGRPVFPSLALYRNKQAPDEAGKNIIEHRVGLVNSDYNVYD